MFIGIERLDGTLLVRAHADVDVVMMSIVWHRSPHLHFASVPD